MMELTKERLQQIVHAAGLEPCDHEEVFDSITVGEIVMMARQLLAGMEQEPVAWRWNYGGSTDWRLQEITPSKGDNKRCPRVIQPLYAAPQLPQPAVPDALDDYVNSDEHPLLWSHNKGWNACRAAMLQGAEPVSQPYTLRDGWVAVPVEITREMRLQIHPIAEATCTDCGRSVTADCEDNVLLSWADMIAAAPQQEVR